MTRFLLFVKELYKITDVYNACSDWSKPVFGSGHPNTEDYRVVVIL